jgi:hypothetical protein
MLAAALRRAAMQTSWNMLENWEAAGRAALFAFLRLHR